MVAARLVARLAPLALVSLVGCGHPAAGIADAPAEAAPFLDGPPAFCDAGGASHVTVTRAGVTTTYDRAFGGGVWLIGPVAPGRAAAPPAGAGMTASLLLTTADHLPQATAIDCRIPGQIGSPCTLDGVVMETGALPADGELGAWPIQIAGTHDASPLIDGTMTITAFTQPFLHAPGRITGTLAAGPTTAGDVITGTFDATFCAGLLTATI
jgi:hypothetical protein